MTFGTSVVIQIITMVGGILAARLLGPGGRGELAAVILWPTVLATVGSLGRIEATVYFSGREDETRVPSILTQGFVVAILQTFILVGLGAWLVPLLMREYSNLAIGAAKLYLAFIPLTLIAMYQISILHGRMKMGAYNLLRFLVHGSYVFGIVIVAVVGLVSVRNVAIASLAANLITLLVASVCLWKLGWLRWSVDLSLLRPMLSFGLKSHFGAVSSVLNLRLDQMFLALLLSPAMLGLYVVAVTVSAVVNFVSNAISIVAFPTIAQKEGEYRLEVLSRFLCLSLWTSGITAIALMALVPWLIPFFFGRDFTDSVRVAQVLIVASVVLGMNSTFASGLRGLGKPLISTYAEFVGLGVTVPLLLILLPRFQIMGAALASLFAYLSSFIYMFWYSWRKLSIQPLHILLPRKEDVANLTVAIRRGSWRANLRDQVAP